MALRLEKALQPIQQGLFPIWIENLEISELLYFYESRNKLALLDLRDNLETIPLFWLILLDLFAKKV